MEKVPPFQKYFNPILTALKTLGGSATISELYEAVVAMMDLTEEQLNITHDPDRGSQTEVGYRMAWARTYLKKARLITNSSRGVWALTDAGKVSKRVAEMALMKQVREADSPSGKPTPFVVGEDDDHNEADVANIIEDWKEELLDVLQKIEPVQFERLCQRILRESGFIEVHVVGRTNDGGIDGTGILRIHNLVSFHVLFQCKRWKGSVGSREIRDFRGAMVGRTDKGLFITTGTFSREAVKEATRDGAPPIDLVDGEQLLDMLKGLELGVKTEMIEKVTIKPEWFQGL